jgi:hypothetical protein
VLRIRPEKWIILAVALAVAALGAGQTPQATNTQPTQQKAEKSSDKQAGKKPILAEVPRAGTQAAVEAVAKQAAQKPEEAKQRSTSEAVVEFHATEAEAATSTSGKPESQKSKQAKNVHGTVYGATDAKNVGTHRAGGAVGATSKSGKTSVYVETEGARTTPPR